MDYKNLDITIIINNTRDKIKNSSCYNQIIKLLKEKKIPHHLINSYPFNRKDSARIAKSNFLISLGGDGTILSVLRKIKKPNQVKIIPVNFGTLGYITSVHETNAISLIKNYLENKTQYFKEDHRNLLKIQYKKKTYFSLNEVVLVHKQQVRPITINACINNRINAKFIGDGILVSTSTGSTGYNLSLRGPILSPEIKAFILNPISPHSLNLKPIVLSKNDTVRISSKEDSIFAIDGQKIDEVQNSFIDCALAEEELIMIKPIKENHYHILKNKLKWGG